MSFWGLEMNFDKLCFLKYWGFVRNAMLRQKTMPIQRKMYFVSFQYIWRYSSEFGFIIASLFTKLPIYKFDLSSPYKIRVWCHIYRSQETMVLAYFIYFSQIVNIMIKFEHQSCYRTKVSKMGQSLFTFLKQEEFRVTDKKSSNENSYEEIIAINFRQVRLLGWLIDFQYQSHNRCEFWSTLCLKKN